MLCYYVWRFWEPVMWNITLVFLPSYKCKAGDLTVVWTYMVVYFFHCPKWCCNITYLEAISEIWSINWSNVLTNGLDYARTWVTFVLWIFLNGEVEREESSVRTIFRNKKNSMSLYFIFGGEWKLSNFTKFLRNPKSTIQFLVFNFC